MANQVFENALATIRQAMSTVESEVMRLSTVEVRAQGAQQRLDALKTQETELQAIVANLAKDVATARQTIADAEAAKESLAQIKRTAAAFGKS